MLDGTDGGLDRPWEEGDGDRGGGVEAEDDWYERLPLARRRPKRRIWGVGHRPIDGVGNEGEVVGADGTYSLACG